MTTLRGPLQVTTESEPPSIDEGGVTINRNIVRKSFSGDLAGSSEAQMIAARTPDPASAGYVAVEHFNGSVDGKVGTLVFQHFGLVDNGQPELKVVIVPGTGTGELEGIKGTLVINNDDGDHTYELDYTLP